jgi:hypothetical protein
MRSQIDVRLDQRIGTRQDLRSESRGETRAEAETGTRTETRVERRFETDFDGGRDDAARQFLTTAPSFENVEFENAVATPAAVLGVSSLDSGGFDEDDFDVSAGFNSQ